MHLFLFQIVKRLFYRPLSWADNLSLKQTEFISRQHGTRNAAQETRNLSSHIDLHTHAGSAFDNRVTLTFDL